MHLEEFAIIEEESERKLTIFTDNIDKIKDYFCQSDWYIDTIKEEKSNWHKVILLKGFLV